MEDYLLSHWYYELKPGQQISRSHLEKTSMREASLSIEPYSSSSAKISFQNETAYILHILMKDTGMHLFSFSEGGITRNGIILSRDVSHKLGVSVGDEVEISTPFGKKQENNFRYSSGTRIIRGLFAGDEDFIGHY